MFGLISSRMPGSRDAIRVTDLQSTERAQWTRPFEYNRVDHLHHGGTENSHSFTTGSKYILSVRDQ